MADHLSSDFCMKGINSQGLHGGRSQSDREMSLNMLRSGEVQILVATDLASRGIDVPDITYEFRNKTAQKFFKITLK